MLSISYTPSQYTFSSNLPKRLYINTDADSVNVSILFNGSVIFSTTLYAFNKYANLYDIRSVIEAHMVRYNRPFAKFQINAKTSTQNVTTPDERYIIFSKVTINRSAKDFLQSSFLTTQKAYSIPRNAWQTLRFIPVSGDTIEKYTECLVKESDKPLPTILRIDEGSTQFSPNILQEIEISPDEIWRRLKTDAKLLSFTIHRGNLAKTFYVMDRVPDLILSAQNEFLQFEYIFLNCTTKRILNLDRATAVCNGETSFYDDNTDTEYEVETTMLSYEDATRISLLLLSKTITIVTNINEYEEDNIIITDITSEISDADNATNSIKFKFKYKQNITPMDAPRPKNTFTVQYTPTFD